LPPAALETAMTKAILARTLDPAVVLIDTRRQLAGPDAAVSPIGALTRYDRPAPTMTSHDELLTGDQP
jgi:hypothetical protein